MNNSHRGSFKPFGNADSKLWKPVKVGHSQLSHRVVLAPLTRMRAIDGVPNDLHVEYYKQRASQGGLLITEGTFITRNAGGYPNVPGIYSQEQINAWKKVTDAVHEKGGIIYCQLWAIGRANAGLMPDVRIVSASDLPFKGGKKPEPLSIEEIHQYVLDYKQAALNAIEAGFDGVEVHSAHGYLLDQFVQKSSNIRVDLYGGAIENRTRFLFDALEIIANTVGQKRMALRISPFSVFQGMGQEDPFETFGYIVQELKRRFPQLSYLSCTDPRLDAEVGGTVEMNKFTSDYFRAILRGLDPKSVSKSTIFEEPNETHPTLFLAAGGYAASDAEPVSDRTNDLIGFGRFFIANPDLPFRLKNGLELNPYDRSTFYTQDEKGYTTYPFSTDTTKKFVPPNPDELHSKVLTLTKENKELKEKLPDMSLLKETVLSHRGSLEYGTNPNSRVWKPIKCGNLQLEHRIAMAPLTRMRAIDGVPQDIVAEYYNQRATKGGLLVSEATFIAKEAGGYPFAPSIETKEQVEGWKKVTKAVHDKGGFIYCQLWALGRSNDGEMPDVKVVSSGTVPKKDGVVPEEMTVDDIKRYLQHYKQAALNAIEAGFDGVEVHGAHSYLLEQFLRPTINATRNDEYSGSLENRARFMLEALEVVVNAVGQERAAIRISPFTPEEDIDPYENWGYVVEQIRDRFPKLSYLSVTDPRLNSFGSKKYSSDYFRAILRGYKGSISKLAEEEQVRFDEPSEENPTLYLSAGGYTASDAESCGDRTGDLIGYGRLFIANPDLPHRIKNGLVLNSYDRSTFYAPDEKGLLDYPFADETTPKFIPLTKRPVNEVLLELQASHDSYMHQELLAKIQVKKIQKKVDALETLEKEKMELDSKLEQYQLQVNQLESQLQESQAKIAELEVQTEQMNIKDTKPKEAITEEQHHSCFCQ